MNLLNEIIILSETLTINQSDIHEHLFKAVGSLSDANVNYVMQHKNLIVEIFDKFADEQKEQLKELKESSKSYRAYVKENI